MTQSTRDLIVECVDDFWVDGISGCLSTGVYGFHSEHYIQGERCQYCGHRITDQELMNSYLARYCSDNHYRTLRVNAPEFLAVLATAEYHEHWSQRK